MAYRDDLDALALRRKRETVESALHAAFLYGEHKRRRRALVKWLAAGVLVALAMFALPSSQHRRRTNAAEVAMRDGIRRGRLQASSRWLSSDAALRRRACLQREIGRYRARTQRVLMNDISSVPQSLDLNAVARTCAVEAHYPALE